MKLIYVIGATLSVLTNYGSAYAADTPTNSDINGVYDFLKAGTPYANIRYRYEFVDQDGLPENANAHTVRTKLGYKTADYDNALSGVVELESINGIGAENYNDSVNGKTNYPNVNDPEDFLLNQAYLDFHELPQTNLVVGRKSFGLDNQRWVGVSGWRQNDNAYDMASVTNTSLENTTLLYAYLDDVNTPLGHDHPDGKLDLDSHLFNVAYSLPDVGKIIGYGYLVEYQDNPNQTTHDSSKTFGARFEGKYAIDDNTNFLPTAEYANQSDYANQPANFSLDYYLIEPAVSWNQWVFKTGLESMEGNGVVALQTPLGSRHSMNGWVNKFSTTPVNGLEDYYLGGIYKIKSNEELLNGIETQAFYHNFNSEKDSSHYGNELDIRATQTFCDNYSVSLEYANYQADELLTDTQKFTLMTELKF